MTIIPKSAYGGAVKLWNAAKMAAFPVSGHGVSAACVFLPQGSRRDERWSEQSGEAGEPTGAREHVCGPGVILTASVKGAREGARVKIMPVGRLQTAGRASRSGAGHTIVRRGDSSRELR